MVEIAKALSFKSKLIIMDEPASSLTGEEFIELAKIIQQLKAQGISIIYISHKLAEVFEFCDVVSVMRDGRIIDTKAKSEFTRNELITKMVGRTIENEYPPRPNSVGPPCWRSDISTPASCTTSPSPSTMARSWAWWGWSAPAGPRSSARSSAPTRSAATRCGSTVSR